MIKALSRPWVVHAVTAPAAGKGLLTNGARQTLVVSAVDEESAVRQATSRMSVWDLRCGVTFKVCPVEEPTATFTARYGQRPEDELPYDLQIHRVTETPLCA